MIGKILKATMPLAPSRIAKATASATGLNVTKQAIAELQQKRMPHRSKLLRAFRNRKIKSRKLEYQSAIIMSVFFFLVLAAGVDAMLTHAFFTSLCLAIMCLTCAGAGLQFAYIWLSLREARQS